MLRTLFRLLGLLSRSDRKRLAGLVVLLLVNSLLETVGIGALLPFISIIADPGVIERHPALALIARVTGCTEAHAFLQLVGFGIIGLILAKNVFQMVVVRLRTRFVYRQQALLATDLMGRYMRAPWWWRLHRNSADLTNTVRLYPDVAFGVVTNSAMEMLAELLVLAGLTALLTFAAPLVMAVLGALIGVLTALFLAFFPKRMTRLGSFFGGHNAGMQRRLQEGLGAAKEVRLLGREDYFVERFAVVARERGQNQTEQEAMRALPRQVLELVLAAGLVLAALLLLAQGQSATLVVSVLGLFAAASFRLMPSFSRLMAAANNIQYGHPTVVGLFNELDELAAMEARRPPPPPAGSPRPTLEEALHFDRVSFRYPGAEGWQLSDISLTVRRGESVGLVGASGAGKSTLTDLILGLLEPTEGRILADGADISGNLRLWQDRIGYVPQSIYLSDDTLRRNIAIGLADDHIDDERLRRALDMAQLTELVAQLPQGLDTPVGEMGARLSGGQRQRIGIARALYNDPALLVMDEATSALDGATEKEISAAVASLAGHKTVVLVAHRLSTVRHCDRIFLLEHGRLTGAGRFDELVAGNDTFRRMVALADIS